MHHVKRNIDAVEEHFSSENINSEIGFNCVFFPNHQASRSHSRNGFSRDIWAEWFSNDQEIKRPNTVFSKKKKKILKSLLNIRDNSKSISINGFAIGYYTCYLLSHGLMDRVIK